jgi:DNA invertase Pin-like site-specific DNA recombinase
MIYAYYRVSTDEQDYENQKSGVVRYCEYKGLELDKEVIEEGVSGKIEYKKRKLGKLVKELKSGDLLIVSELSRLSRSMTDTFDMVKVLKDKGVNIYCVKENMEINDSALGLMIMSVFAFSAQIERERISQRTKEALAKKKADGVHLGRPYGSRNKISKIDKDDYLVGAMVMQGVNFSEMARRIGVDRNTLRRYVKEKYAI